MRFSGDDPLALSTRAKTKRRDDGVLRYARDPQAFGRRRVRGSGAANEADLGTAFALATSLYGNSMLQVSGNLGYGSQTGVPAAAFRTSYSRDLGGEQPEVSVTMRQLYLPGRLGAALTGNEGALPMLRSISASFDDRTELTDSLSVQYGFTLDSSRSWTTELREPVCAADLSLGDNGERGVRLHLRQRASGPGRQADRRMPTCSAT